MAKTKNFKGKFSETLGEVNKPTTKKVGRPKTKKKKITNTAEEGTKEDEIRATFIVNKTILGKLKGVAYWDRLKIKDVVAEALEDYIKKHEKKNGEIKPAPKK